MSLPLTEMTMEGSASIDALAPCDALTAMLDAQIAAVKAVSGARPGIEAAAARIAETIRSGGRLIYAAAGSSGLMALADGSELPGTFGIPEAQIRICMAGGIPVDGRMPGDTEDDIDEAANVAQSLAPGDLVIAVSASGTTPYACEIARRARAANVAIVAIANVPGSKLLTLADVAICLPTPPEAVAGSTRLGAGTAQKVALNMMSTLAGVLLGHVHDGMMVNLHPDNTKLRQRAARNTARIAGVSGAVARAALAAAGGRTKPAVLIALGASPKRAAALLEQHHQRLGPCITTLDAARTTNKKPR